MTKYQSKIIDTCNCFSFIAESISSSFFSISSRSKACGMFHGKMYIGKMKDKKEKIENLNNMYN